VSGGRDRFVPPAVAELTAREGSRLRADGQKRYGPVVRVNFLTADTPRAVAHGLSVVPDGFEHARCTGPVFEVNWPDRWTEEIAVLQTSQAYTIAVGRFFVWAAPIVEEAV
jgi:hypothetical protein